jgi:hypothetical protein
MINLINLTGFQLVTISEVLKVLIDAAKLNGCKVPRCCLTEEMYRW